MLLAVVAAGAVGTVHVGLQLLKWGVGHQLAHVQKTPVAVGMDEHPQAVVKLPQDIVGVAAHNDAAFPVGDLADGADLSIPQLLAQGAVVEVEKALGKAELMGDALVPAAHLLRRQVGAGLGGL